MRNIIYLLTILLICSCDGPVARKPVSTSTPKIIKSTVERNKDLLALEVQIIYGLVSKDTSHTYLNTKTGSWYYYETKNDTLNYLPKGEDIVTMTYNIMTLTNDTIYSAKEIGVQQINVDKPSLFKGLRNNFTLLKENEKATFIYPSSLAFGYHGDDNRIAPNTPIKSSVEILKIEKK
ncbi:gliding motility-associated peptidyl-prolyl isomerase GldI [Cellulophaga baltica]|uniref:gliding motility-associated peptidyl-prolyl isomerase GldI n=1 Tax=Cellulophaga TaxID=104264 RepID=UPI001C0701A0|nr:MULTISPECIES: gliding motility-associated peptidyl-prolyl isomerase GldI [Cellulophaga]MBU2996510.1 gliding motility-associated peptidyl-prolyl isomerase GldI [Cellulophaga baltica]MDO6767904.1 gliding motility-associated peptidyl-prolyl isomerase GldI [Cellulophaga sp. 1_MG-2023]